MHTLSGDPSGAGGAVTLVILVLVGTIVLAAVAGASALIAVPGIFYAVAKLVASIRNTPSSSARVVGEYLPAPRLWLVPTPIPSPLDRPRATLAVAITAVFVAAALVLAARGTSPAIGSQAASGPSVGPGVRATFYVSPSGNDANDGLSPGKPLRGIQKALDKAAAGSVVELAAGTYLQDFRTRRDGLVSAPITIAGPRGAVVKGAGRGHVVDVNHNHHVLTGFVIDGLFGKPDDRAGYRNKLLWVQGTQPGIGVTGLRVDNMVIQKALGECVRLRYFAVANEIENTTITNCGLGDFVFGGVGKNGEGIYIGTAPEQLGNGVNPTADVDKSDKNWIHDNTIDTKGNECVDIKEGASANLVEGNSCTGQRDPDSGGLDARGNGNVFRLNTVFGNVGAGIRLGGDLPVDGTLNDVYGNTIRDNRAGGVKFVRAPQGRVCGNVMSGNTKDSAGELASQFLPAAPCG